MYLGKILDSLNAEVALAILEDGQKLVQVVFSDQLNYKISNLTSKGDLFRKFDNLIYPIPMLYSKFTSKKVDLYMVNYY